MFCYIFKHIRTLTYVLTFLLVNIIACIHSILQW